MRSAVAVSVPVKRRQHFNELQAENHHIGSSVTGPVIHGAEVGSVAGTVHETGDQKAGAQPPYGSPLPVCQNLRRRNSEFLNRKISLRFATGKGRAQKVAQETLFIIRLDHHGAGIKFPRTLRLVYGFIAGLPKLQRFKIGMFQKPLEHLPETIAHPGPRMKTRRLRIHGSRNITRLPGVQKYSPSPHNEKNSTDA